MVFGLVTKVIEGVRDSVWLKVDEAVVVGVRVRVIDGVQRHVGVRGSVSQLNFALHSKFRSVMGFQLPSTYCEGRRKALRRALRLCASARLESGL